LQQAHIANRIRALLFAGIRATVLWRQLGGSQINLVWRRSYFRNLARSLADEHG
jgi:high frequency lysogenization protein